MKKLFSMIGCLICVLAMFSSTAMAQTTIDLQPIGTFATGIFAQGAAEIVAHDPTLQRLFVVNAADQNINVLDISNPKTPLRLFTINIAPYGKQANSVAVHHGTVAAAVENENKQAPGSVIFFNTEGSFLSQVTVGALPDMITFSPNGLWVLVANEGEPNDDYTVDPEGSVSIIDIRRGAKHVTQDDVRTADFTAFNNTPLDYSIRIFGPNATVAQDLEPEYITVSKDSKKAWVTLQENNAIAVIDIIDAKVEKLIGLGFKDHMEEGNGIDASNKDGFINISNWPTYGMYMPDSIASYKYRGETFLVTANEGDSRDYAGFSEETRVKDVILDPVAFPDQMTLQAQENLGRLKITTTNGDLDNDGDYDALFSFGARSFSIRTDHGHMVFDSGDDFERITAAAFPDDFNSDEVNGSFDDRSDDKGPEPEGLALGQIFDRTYAFIGLERIGGIMIYDITNPFSPSFIQYVNTRIFTGNAEAGTAGDLSPEGIIFIPAQKSPTLKPLLVVAYEVSGTTTIFEINVRD